MLLVQDILMTTANSNLQNSAADIYLSANGKILYAYNRGDFNEIVVFNRIIHTGVLADSG